MASSDKSEKPSPKRVERSRKDGNFPSTRQFLGGAQFVVFVALLQNVGGRWLNELRLLTGAALQRAFGPPLTPEGWLLIARDGVFRCIGPLVLVGLAMSVFSLALQLGLTGFGASFEKVAPDLKRLNPISKLRNIANQNVSALLQAILLLPICGYAIYALVSENADRLLTLSLKSVDIGAAEGMSSLLSLLWRGAAVFFIFGSVELFREKLRYTRQLRMTKQEVKD
jgi:flagellar biosynthesis protein FlhB